MGGPDRTSSRKVASGASMTPGGKNADLEQQSSLEATLAIFFLAQCLGLSALFYNVFEVHLFDF